jgi:hypothetical protein
MALLKYVGTSHFRELLAEDFAKVGVEVKAAIVFGRNEATKVSDEVADAIHKLVGDEFEQVSEDVKAEIRDPEKTPPTAQVPVPLTDGVNPSEVDNPVNSPTASQVEQPDALAE